jgi:rhamnose transport system ATP-binding protein
VILVSSELPEVTHLAHRVIVMRRGRQVAEFANGTLDPEDIVAAASGLDGSSSSERGIGARHDAAAGSAPLTELAA